MIIFATIILTISTILQGLMSRYLGYTYDTLSLFSTLYILISLLILNPYFTNKKKYFILLIVFGLISDIMYTDVFLLNTSFFIGAYFVSKFFHSFFPYNFLTVSISNLLCVFLYHIATFLFLLILGYDNYSFLCLLKVLGCSVISTIIYSIVIYFSVNFVNDKMQFKEVR